MTGVATFRGEPLADATIEFVPTAGGGAGAQARTDAEGNFDVVSFRDNGRTSVRGLPPGEYRVTVVKFAAPPGEASLNRPPANVLPKTYQSADSSPLSATVAADGESHLQLKLD